MLSGPAGLGEQGCWCSAGNQSQSYVPLLFLLCFPDVRGSSCRKEALCGCQSKKGTGSNFL